MKNNKKIIMRIAVAVLIFIVGTVVNIPFSNLIDYSFKHIRIGKEFLDYGVLIGNISGSEQLLKIFWLTEALICLMSVVFAISMVKPYEASTYKVTNEVSIPIPYGQGQHGTAWFMSKKEREKSLSFVEIDTTNPNIRQLISAGKKRHDDIDNGVVTDFTEQIKGSIFDKGGMTVSREQTATGERLCCITDDVHTLTLGATGCGKTRTLVLQSICTLALAGEGIVVSDPKGEIYHYTRKFLENLGYTVHCVDFQNTKKSDCYNPLQTIIDAVNEDDIDEAQMRAWDFTSFIVEKNDHSEPIWTNGEMSVIAAAILCVVYDNKDHPEYQNLTNVYEFISKMSRPAPDSGGRETMIEQYVRGLPDSHPAKATLGIALVAPGKTAGSFYTSALTTLKLFTLDNIYAITRKSDFKLDDLGTKPKQALFYVLPDQKTTFYPIVTLLVTQQYEQLVTFAKKHGNRLPHRVNYVLDEFGNFAQISDFEAKMTVARGYGIRWNLFIQSFDQLVKKYDKEVANIIKSNCQYWIYLNAADRETNEEISARLGKYTTSSYSTGASYQRFQSVSTSSNIQLSERALLTSDEISRFKRPYQLLISQFSPAVMQAPDISKWLYNDILGLGDKDHNTMLIQMDEQTRPEKNANPEKLIWKPWIRRVECSEVDDEQEQQAVGNEGTRNTYMRISKRKGGM